MSKKKIMILIVTILIVAVIAGIIIYRNSTYSLEEVKEMITSGKETDNMHVIEEVKTEETTTAIYEQYKKDNLVYSITKDGNSKITGRTLYNKETQDYITISDDEKIIIIDKEEPKENKYGPTMATDSFMTVINSHAGADYEYCGKVKVDGKECIKVSLLNKNATERIEKDYYYINLEDNNVLKCENYIGTDANNLEKDSELNYTYSFDTVKDEDMLHFDRADFPDYQIFDNRTIGTRHFVRIHHNR